MADARRVVIPLEQIRPGMRVRGILPGETAEILDVRRWGQHVIPVVDVTYRTRSGRIGTCALCRADRLSWGDPPSFAVRTSHLLREPPGESEPIPYDDDFNLDEFRRLRLGVIPEEMEDKWFIYHELDTLYLHRSWTGYCVFTVRLRRRGDRVDVEEARVATDVTSYRRSPDDEYEVALLRFLIRSLMLGEPMPFPVRPGTPEGLPSALFAHHVAGRYVSGPMLEED